MGLADALRSELAAHKIDVHIYLPATMDTPGHEIENNTKPLITEHIEGITQAANPDVAAKQLISGLAWGRFIITNDMLTELMRVIGCISGPRPNPITEV
jgi:3-dehydrosphinganine reductase